MKFPSKLWSVLLRSASTLSALTLVIAVPFAQAQVINAGLWHASTASVSVLEGDQSRGTPKADLAGVNSQIAADRIDDGQAPVFSLSSGSDLFTVQISGEDPVLSLKAGQDLDYEAHQTVPVEICAEVAGSTPNTTQQECYSLTINVRPRDEAPVLRKTFGPNNILYLTAADALPRYNLLDHFADPERQNIVGQIVGQTTIGSQDGYSITASLTGDVLLSFTKSIPQGVTLSGATVHIYRFRVRTTDPIGNHSATVEFTMHLKLSANTPPVFLGGVTRAIWAVDENFAGAFTQTVTARDVDAGDEITYSLEGQDSAGQLRIGGACLSINPSSGVVSIGCNGATFDHETSATNEFRIVAQDRFGGTASVVVEAHVNDINEPPQARNFDLIPPFNMYVGATRTLNLPYHFFDPEGTDLQFVAVALSANAEITNLGDVRTITAVREGTSRINVVATDGTGLTTSHSISVKVKRQGENTPPVFDSSTTGFRFSLRENAPQGTRVGSPNPATDPDNDVLYYRLLGHADRFSVQQSNGQIFVNKSDAFDFEREETISLPLEVSDNFGGRDLLNITVLVQDVNEPPIKRSEIPNQTVFERDSVQVNLARYFSDPDRVDRGNLGYEARVEDATVASATVLNQTLTINGLTPGDTTVSVTAVDRGNLRISSTFTVRVDEIVPPSVENPIPDQVLVPGTPKVIDLTSVFADAHNLTFAEPESSDPAVVLATLFGADRRSLVLLGRNAGTSTVTISATSVSGQTISHSFRVMVNSDPQVVSEIADQVVNLGSSATVDLAPVFSDADAGDTLRYTSTIQDSRIARVTINGTFLVITGVKSGSTTASVTATDNHGGSVTETFGVRVNSVPTVVAPIQPVTLVSSDASTVIELANIFNDPDSSDILVFTAESSNTAAATVSVTGNILLVRVVSPGAGTVLVTATDPHGETVSTSFNFFVNAAPVLSTPFEDLVLLNPSASSTLDLSSHFSDPDFENLTFTAESDDSSVATVNVRRTTLTVQAAGVGNATITVTAADNHGIEATGSFMVRVNAVPMISMEIGDVTLTHPEASHEIELSSHFSDEDMESLSFSAQSSSVQVATVNVNESTLTVQGVNAGTTTITVTAADELGVEVTTSFMVRVNAVPVLSMAIDDVILKNPEASRDIDLSNNFSDADATDSLTYSASSEDEEIATVSIDGSTLTVAGVSPGTTAITVTATDDLGASVTGTFNVRVNAVPMVSMVIDDMTLLNPEASQIVDLTMHFSDADMDTLTFAAVSDDTSVATVSVSTTTLTVQAESPGNAAISVTATDPLGAYAMTFFDVRVNAVPMVSMAIDDMILANPDTSLTIDLNQHFDDADMESLTYSAESAAVRVAAVSVSGSILTVRGVNHGTTTITVRATDPLGTSAMTSFSVRVNAVPMVANPLADVVVTVGTPLTIDVSNTFSDADSGDTLTITAVSSNVSLATISMNSSTNQLTITGVAPGDVDVTVTATDDHGASASDTFSTTVKTVPMVAATLPDVMLEVGGEPHVSDISSGFSDADGDALSYVVELSVSGIASSVLSGSSLTLVAIDQGTTEATVTATDPDGNSAVQSFTINVDQDALYAAANKSLSAFGRAMLGSVSNAIGNRVTTADVGSESESAAQVLSQLAQNQHSSSGFGSNIAQRDILDIGGRNNLGLSSSMLGNPVDSIGFSPRKFAMNLTGTGIGVWGAADVTNYEGTDYDGSASFFHLGADVRTSSELLFGLAITRGSGSNDFSYGTANREMDIALTAFSPYARYSPSELTSIWGAGTFGNGEVEISGGPATSSNDLSANMFLIGGRHTLRELNYVSLSIRGDAAFANLSTDGEDDLSADLDTSVNRIRAVVEASFDAGNGMEPFVDLGFRNDGGDGDSGSGVELAGGVVIQSDAINVEARAHTLVSHGADDYSESGVSVVARLDLAGAQGTGFAAELAPRWGSDYGDSGLLNNLYDPSTRTGLLYNQRDASISISSRLQYGVAVSNDHYLITPFVNFDDQSSNRYQLLIGAELHSLIRDTSRLNVSAAVGHSRVSAGKSGPIFGVNANLRFK